jgi:hypothetical protein
MKSILEEAISVTGTDRPSEYGHPLDHFSKTVGAINAQFTDVVKRRLAEGKPMLEPEDWPRFLILDKVSRSTEAYKRDNMVDVSGYAQTYEWVIEERDRRDQQRRRG